MFLQFHQISGVRGSNEQIIMVHIGTPKTLFFAVFRQRNILTIVIIIMRNHYVTNYYRSNNIC